MPRTAPAPNVPVIPGMNPGMIVAGGGGAGGGAGAAGGRGNGSKAGANGQGGENGAADGGKGADACGQGASAGACTVHSEHATRGDPVDAVTGEMFTVPERDLYLSGPFALDVRRSYSSKQRRRDIGLGWGWSFSLGWDLKVRSGSVTVTNGSGASVKFPSLKVGQEELAKGWILKRTAQAYELDAADDFTHLFTPLADLAEEYRLTAIVSPNQTRVELRYDRTGTLVEATDSAGRLILFPRTQHGRIRAIDVPDPTSGTSLRFAEYEYDDAGRLTAATHADGETVRYWYDEHNLVTSYQLPTGLTFFFKHDSDHRCVETWGEYPGGVDAALDDGLPATLTDGKTPARGIFHCRFEYFEDFSYYYDSVRSQRFVFGPNGEIESAVGDGGVTTMTYDQYGNPSSHTNPLGETRRFEYDERGRLLSETDPLGRTFVILRDANGRVVQNTDAAGGVATAVRDSRGNVVAITDQRGATTRYSIDARGLITEAVTASGAATQYTSDSHGNLIQMRLADGAVWKWKYDFYGRPIEREDPVGSVSRYVYTIGGKLIESVDRLSRSTTWGYDGGGQMAWKRDCAGRTTQYGFGGLRWPACCRFADGTELAWRYNREGWVVRCLNERNEAHISEHDRNGNVVREQTYDRRTLSFGHDGLSRVAWREERPDERETYAYTPLGELSSREYPDGAKDEFHYNERNERVGAASPGVHVELERDATGNVTAEVQTVEGVTCWVKSTFNLVGARVGLATSFGHEERFELDVMSRRRKIILSHASEGSPGGSVEIRIERDSFGYPRVWTLPLGARLEDEYDRANRLVRRTLVPREAPPTDPAVLGPAASYLLPRPGGEAYTYSETDELVQVRDSELGTTEYKYDVRGRITERQRSGQAPERFAQDGICNLFTPEEDRAYGSGGRLLQQGESRYHWDDRGQLVRKVFPDRRETQFEWNGRGLLIGLVLPDKSRLEFLYDAFSRRVLKRHLDAAGNWIRSVRFVWDDNVVVHEVSWGPQMYKRVRTFVYDEGGYTPWAQCGGVEEDEKVRWQPWQFIVCDPNDIPLRIVSGSGEQLGRMTYSVWGRRETQVGSVSTPFAFQGQYIDDETGFHYNRARYYDPDSGRYISPDPVGLEGGSNPYVYCPDPISWADPLGLQYWPHTCTASLTDGDDNQMTPPNPVYRNQADANSGNSAGGGFYSGYANNGNNNCWPGRTEGTNNPQQWRDTYAQGNMGVARQQCHTEQKAMRWADQMAQPPPVGQNANLAGGTMNLGGQLPPCNTCHAAMRSWSADRGCSIVYSHPVNRGVTYHGNGNPPTHHPPW